MTTRWLLQDMRYVESTSSDLSIEADVRVSAVKQ